MEKHIVYTAEIDLREIISHMPGNVYWTDCNGIYKGCNLNVVKTLRLASAQDIVGKTIHELITDKKIAADVAIIDREVIRGGQPIEIEQNAFDGEGNDTVYLTRKIPLHNQEGVVIGILGISIDITKRKLDEQAVLLAKEKAEAANRAKTEFLGNMSHDMISPLTGILVASEAIIENERALDEDRKMAAIILGAGKQLKSFFTSCLDLSKLEMEHWSSKISVFSITQLVRDIQALYLPKAIEKQLSLSVECQPNLPESVEGHYDGLYRALLNLTGNALKFTKTGSVTIRAFCTDGPDDQHPVIHLQVQDTGMGIPEDKYQVIFEKLQRLTPAYSGNIEGSGIGLYIVDQFVKRMGGTIQVESQVEKGSTFTVSVPLSLAEAVQ